MDASIRNHGWFCRRRTHVLGICQKKMANPATSMCGQMMCTAHSGRQPIVGRNPSDKYLAVLETMDQQLECLFHYIKEDPYYRDNTLILICAWTMAPKKEQDGQTPWVSRPTLRRWHQVLPYCLGSPLDNEKGARQQGERFFRHRSGSKLTGVYWSFHSTRRFNSMASPVWHSAGATPISHESNLFFLSTPPRPKCLLRSERLARSRCKASPLETALWSMTGLKQNRTIWQKIPVKQTIWQKDTLKKSIT